MTEEITYYDEELNDLITKLEQGIDRLRNKRSLTAKTEVGDITLTRTIPV